MASIKAIEERSVHQIQSGQVIVDLNSVVKELVENSIDAGATSVEVRFKNQGLEAIEVQDNGKGIAPDDFETLALKHYTSKLSSYEDLTSLETFGFRGEALSSLCALSKFRVLTARAEDGAVGKKLDFDVSGKLKSTSVAAAQKGTVVYVEDIFHSLPVRRRELEKNIKREYNKVISLLYQYACISVGVRFSVSNQMPKAKKVSVFSTKSNTTTKENITNVFGAKTLLALARLDLNLEMAPSSGPSTQGARNWSTHATDRSTTVRVEGHVSKPVFGEGRQAPDRQMFFVNGRPCQLPQISKAFNEVYKGFNVSQSPFIFANLIMDTSSYDVNVSPDKRTIMLHDQAALLESLKSALTELFENTDHTVPQSTLPNRKLPAYQPLSMLRKESTGASQARDASEDEEASAEESDGESGKRPAPSNGVRAPAVGSPSNLIHNWLERDTEQRKEPKRPNLIAKGHVQVVSHNANSSPALAKPISANQENSIMQEKDDEVTLSTITAPSENSSRHPVDAVNNPDPLSTPYDDLFSQRPPSDGPMGTETDIEKGSSNAEQEDIAQGPCAIDSANMAPPSPLVTQDSETAIPVTSTSSQKSAPGPVPNAFDRMRPKRTPLQTAEITVGNVTMTKTIGGSPPYKKRRVCQPDDSQRVVNFGASPSLARGLRKSFAAPGSQLQIDSSGLTAETTAEAEDAELSADEEGGLTANHLFKNAQTRSSLPEEESPTSDALEELSPAPADEDEWDEEYLDEDEKRIREDEKVARLIQEAEEAAARPSEENLKRAAQALRNGGNRKNATLQLAGSVRTSANRIRALLVNLSTTSQKSLGSGNDDIGADHTIVKDELDSEEAESRLSLTVTKPDFARMRIVGQFNLGFVLAVRPGDESGGEDDLFIIDQHAADEKYNYERLQRTVTLQSQRLVRPKPLELTAIEEEIALNNSEALKANGFDIETTSYAADSDEPVQTGHRCRLLTLPMSKEKTFDLSDLEELLHLLSETAAGSTEIPRPKKVQRMLAMRACRSSIMVGKTLTTSQMRKVVRHMGEMEKPWNCPHGRPTMRHLAGLNAWHGWQEGDLFDADERDAAGNAQKGRNTDWKAWLESRRDGDV